MYSFDSSKQLFIFMLSLGAGFALGVLYDILRAFRLALTKGKAAVVVFDVLYFLVFGFLSFLFILAVNKGEVRFYILFGEALGALIYYFSFGLAAIRITDAFVKLFRKLCSLIFKVVSAPFRLIFKLFKTIFVKIKAFFIKLKKKSRKNRKKLLPKWRNCVYNLSGILRRQKTPPGKDGYRREKRKEKEKNETD